MQCTTKAIQHFRDVSKQNEGSELAINSKENSAFDYDKLYRPISNFRYHFETANSHATCILAVDVDKCGSRILSTDETLPVRGKIY